MSGGLGMARTMEQAISEALRPLKRVEFDQLANVGAFENERVELVRGVLVEMAPIGPDHCDVVELLNELLMPALKGRARVRVQLAFAASDESEPQPDILILGREVPRGVHRHPESALLAIEVAESSLKFDRTVKARLYAEAGIPEYWVFDVPHATVEIFTCLRDGKYREISRHSRSEVLRLSAFPDVEVPLAEVFPLAER
jgi:Uma2 family endonuclease